MQDENQSKVNNFTRNFLTTLLVILQDDPAVVYSEILPYIGNYRGLVFAERLNQS